MNNQENGNYSTVIVQQKIPKLNYNYSFDYDLRYISRYETLKRMFCRDQLEAISRARRDRVRSDCAITRRRGWQARSAGVHWSCRRIRRGGQESETGGEHLVLNGLRRGGEMRRRERGSGNIR